MKATNILVSAAAAISMASAIGFVYAQSGYSDTQTGTTGTSATTSQDATSTMNQDASGTPGYEERVARADRN